MSKPALRDGLVAGGAPAMWESVLKELLPWMRELVPSGSRVLEVGYGDGMLSSYLCRELGWSILGLDIEADAQRRATENARRHGLAERAEFRLVSADETLRHKGQYDAVFIKTVLYNSRSPEEYAAWLDWILSVLRPGGCLVNLETGRANALVQSYRTLRRRPYVGRQLYTSRVEGLYDERFDIVHRRYFGGLSQFAAPLGPVYKLVRALEESVAARTADNCFVAAVLARKPEGGGEVTIPQAEHGASSLSQRVWLGAKRMVDVAGAGTALAASLPLTFGLAAAVKLGSPGPVFYRGLRVAKNGVPFRMLKFRTMVVDAEKIGGASTSGDDPRVTRVGAWMRRYKLDELPQLLNVLMGDMSIVGPRPEVLSEVAWYSAEQRRVLDLRPGITDWASIWNSDEGEVLRGAPDPHAAYKEVIQPTKLRLQCKYRDSLGPLTDLRIVLGTARKLIQPEWMPVELREYGVPGQRAGACQ